MRRGDAGAAARPVTAGPRPEGLSFQLLGPLRAARGEVPVDLGTPPQRAVLAVLLINANRPVGRAALIEAVWPEPPAYAVNLLQKHVSALRRALEPDRAPGEPSRVLTWTGSGYLLTVTADALDLAVFDREVERGRAAAAAGDPATASAALHRAVELWRGPPWADLSGPLLDAERDRLTERRLGVVEDRIEADLRLGRHAQVVPELRRLLAEQPLRERPLGLLMLALHRSGRPGEALSAYEGARHRMLDELGLEPGPWAQRLHRQLLSGEVTGDRGAAPAQGGPSVATTPVQLPHRIPHFAGREAELDRLDVLVGEESADTVVITALAGAAGVGKTALAVHWAHRIRDRYPDGQLYVDLRGFGPEGSIVEPSEAIRGFLDALGVPPREIPAGLDARAGLYRSLLADRRVLVLLDNARDADHVRPLLPGTAGSIVLVTSRDLLVGLVATEAAHLVAVDLLPAAEAHQLLSRRLGRRRVEAEPDAAWEIVRLCSRLPLALAIVAARAAAHPGFALSALAGELRAARGGLDAFDGGDDATDVRAIFSWSYRRLSPPAARLFRLLGLHAGPDIAAPAAASLAGLPSARVRPLLAELARAHLIEEPRPGRYTFHDLLRAYAAERAAQQHPEAERRAAVHRSLDHYLHTAHRAALELHPHRDPLPIPPVPPGVTPEPVRGEGAARAWFAAEHRVLLAALAQAADVGRDALVGQLAWAVVEFQYYQGHWTDQATTQQAALDAARRLGDRAKEAHARRGLASAYTWLGRHDEAIEQHRRALAIFADLGDGEGTAYSHRSMAWVLVRQGRHAEALAHATLALEWYRGSGHPTGEANALNQVGWYHAQLGDYAEALACCERALAMHRERGNRYGMAQTSDSLGYIHHHLGDLDRAVTYYERAEELWDMVRHPYGGAVTAARLGDALAAGGAVAAARTAWRRALAVLESLAPAEAAEVRDRLDRTA